MIQDRIRPLRLAGGVGSERCTPWCECSNDAAQLIAFVRSDLSTDVGKGNIRVTLVIRRRAVSGHRSRCAGFTLMEVIVALAVVGIAATIGVSMFVQSYSLGTDVRDRRIAYGIAESILTEIQRTPAAFEWPAANEQLQPVTKKDTGAKVAPPAVHATYPAANTRVEAQYDKFAWHAYVKQPADIKSCELTAVVSWLSDGRTRSVTLTVLAPRSLVGAKS